MSGQLVGRAGLIRTLGAMDNSAVDDQERGAGGVICSIHTLRNGKLRIVMDDVDNSGKLGQGPWEHRVLVTWKDYDPSDLEDLDSLPESELASFGHYLLARLLAIHRTGT